MKDLQAFVWRAVGVAALGGLAALGVASGNASAQGVPNTPIRYRVADAAGQTVEVSFPFLRLADPLASARVNALLHHLVLQTLAPSAAPAPGAAPVSLPAREETTGLTRLQATDIALLNGARVLSVSLSKEGCGAYCSSSTETLAFDARTGRLLVAPELITPDGLMALARQAAQAHRATLTRTLAQLDQKLAAAKPGSDDRQTLQAQRELYARCLQERYSPGGDLASLYQRDPGTLAVKEGGLRFDAGRCSAHVNQALDEVGDLVYAPGANALRPLLTAYGRALVLGEDGPVGGPDGGQPPAPLNPYAQIFKGKIDGRLPITLFLGASRYGSAADMKPFSEAVYYYDKYRQPIALTVAHEGARYTLTESASPEQAAPPPAPAELTFHIEGRSLKGQWRGGGKTYAFEAQAL